MGLIGEGTYGKVYRPPLKCDSKNFKNSIGKVFSNKDDYNDELKIISKIKNINTRNTFSIPFYESCPENLQLIYKDGGMDLYDFISFKSNKNFRNILNKMKYICLGIKKLIDHKYVHQDIKLENLVYNKTNLYLIDFGLLASFKDIHKHSEFLKYDYIPFPPEYKKFIYHNKFIPYFLKNFSGSTIFGFIKKIYPTWKEDLQTLDAKIYPDKIDIYSLGMVILILYKWSDKKNNKIEELIRGMICFNPVKRWDINKVIAWFN
jgi:serine/threonine protein kinase